MNKSYDGVVIWKSYVCLSGVKIRIFLPKWSFLGCNANDKAYHIKSFVHGHFISLYYDAGSSDYLIIFK